MNISMAGLLNSANLNAISFCSFPTSPKLPLVKSPLLTNSAYFSSLQWSGATRFHGVAKSSRDTKDNHINKEVINLTPQLYDYILANVREPQILRELREETSRMRGSQMQVSPDQAQLLAMLVHLLGAHWCIEVGVYTGYSSLAVALVLPESGRLIACERDENCLAIARRYYERAGVLDKVDVRHALALDTLHDLLNHGEANRYDFAFLDAEKKMYSKYYELLLQLIRPGGVIVIDNVLWYGRVSNPQINDKTTSSIRDFNKLLFNDKRVSTSMHFKYRFQASSFYNKFNASEDQESPCVY